jgi:hypothetical protein
MRLASACVGAATSVAFKLLARSDMILALPPPIAHDDRRAERRLLKPDPELHPSI